MPGSTPGGPTLKTFIKLGKLISIQKMAEKEKTEGLGISAFTLGVLGIIFAGTYGVIISIAGLIFSIVQQKRHKTRMGKTAFILNIIGIVLSIVAIILYYKLVPLLNQFPSA